MRINEIEDFLLHKEQIFHKISKIIGYENYITDNELYNYTDHKFCIIDDTLWIYNHEESEWYDHIISSYSAKGETLFQGESNGYLYVMAYIEDQGWDNTDIYILDVNKRTEDTDWKIGLRSLTV